MVLGGLLALVGAAPARAQAGGMRFVFEPFPPFNVVQDGARPTGLLIEMLRLLCQGGADCLPETPQVLPFRRALQEAATRPMTAMVGLYRHPDREPLYRWVGPLYESHLVLFARSDSPIQLHKLDDARRWRIGVQKDSTHHLFLRGLGFRNLEPTSGGDSKLSSTNLQMLLAGRFDLWLATEESAIAKAELSGEDPRKLRVALTVQQQGLWLALNPQTPEAQVRDWQERVAAFRQTPAYAALLQRFIKPRE